MNIKWDKESTHVQTDQYDLKIRTGRSIRFDNRLTALKMQHRAEANRLYKQITNVAYSRSMGTSSAIYPNVPEIARFERMTSRGEFTVYIVWGIVLNGSKKGKLLQGEYRFVVVWEDELEQCLDSVFDLERILIAS